MRRQITKQLKQSWGFSLVEMAVVIAIMGILMTFGIKLATSYQNKGAFSATVDRQKEIRDTLTAYLGQHGKLPCPAAIPVPGNVVNGEEVRLDDFCANKRGLVPFATLGLPKNSVVDGWDRFFTYSVWDNQDTAPCTALSTTPINGVPQNWTAAAYLAGSNINTYQDGGDGCIRINDDEIVRRSVAVIVSHGPNGFGGVNSKSESVPDFDDDAVDEEKINFITAAPTNVSSQPINLNGFDDIVMGITANDLLNPLKKSGTILSIRELERQYLYTLFNVDSEACTIERINPAILVINSLNQATLSLPYPHTTSLILSSERYCASGTSFPFTPPPPAGL
ncbi:hypothetical protein MTYP_01336 [Methylophilaceae bacterium]|nr:hypothetical protein MTYP_01336 [Methylophilaceae bacterium]